MKHQPAVSNENLAVIALGGNSIIAKGQRGTVVEQFQNVRKTVRPVVELIKSGYTFIVTHGNGPQVGNLLLQNELAKEEVPEVPLGMLDAMTCGSMGYMIEQCLQNEMLAQDAWHNVVTIPAQIIVDPLDPAMDNPTKPIGPFYSEEQARALIDEKGWLLQEDAGRGWRRFVASPYPIDIVEKEAIRRLLEERYVIITGGGGGIPVCYRPDGSILGVDCVIDKDLAGMKLAIAVHARTLIIITGVPKVTINFGTPDEQALDRMTLAQARFYYQQGHFPPGSMGPKMAAAIEFVQADPGNRVVITNEENLVAAVAGEAGTQIVAY
jgi:carbamate kinase